MRIITIVEGVFHPNGRLEELYKQPVPTDPKELQKMRELIEHEGTDAGDFEIKTETKEKDSEAVST